MVSQFESLIIATLTPLPEELRAKGFLIGSVNLLLQGVNVVPKKDIDFATDFETVQEIAKLGSIKVKKYCKEPKGDAELPFSHLFIDVAGTEVEFFDAITYPGSHYFGHMNPENLVEIKGTLPFSILGLNLTHELEICEKVGKTGKAELIKQV
ncbi:hypothetical protein JW962_00420 [Candidatus Dojkabacteria bacterium]|nr:hypothetical protein [Candidatus Dojkabacteria bacterium]